MSEKLVLAVLHQRYKDIPVTRKDLSHSISVVVGPRQKRNLLVLLQGPPLGSGTG